MKAIKTIVSVLTLAVILSSCSSSKETAFSKRKYYNFKRGNTEVALNKPQTTERKSDFKPTVQQQETSFAQPVTNTDVRNETKSATVSAPAKKVNQKVHIRKHEFTSTTAEQEESKTSVRSTKESDKNNTQQLSYKGFKKTMSTFGLVVIAILLPPLAVYLKELSTLNHFWLSVALTLLFWLPGIIFSILVVTEAI